MMDDEAVKAEGGLRLAVMVEGEGLSYVSKPKGETYSRPLLHDARASSAGVKRLNCRFQMGIFQVRVRNQVFCTSTKPNCSSLKTPIAMHDTL